MRRHHGTKTHKRALAVWGLRASYVLSLILIGAICFYFFAQQRTQNQAINVISALGEQFAAVDSKMAALAQQGEAISEKFPSRRPPLPAHMRGMSLAERRDYLADLPADPDIRPARSALAYRIAEAQREMARLRLYWNAAPAALRARIIATAPHMAEKAPFQHHAILLDSERVSSAKSKFDMHWTALEIHSMYENNVALSNRNAQIELRSYLEGLSRQQGETLGHFFLITIAALVLLLMFVFIPVDMAIQRMVARLSAKQREADEAKGRGYRPRRSGKCLRPWNPGPVSFMPRTTCIHRCTPNSAARCGSGRDRPMSPIQDSRQRPVRSASTTASSCATRWSCAADAAYLHKAMSAPHTAISSIPTCAGSLAESGLRGSGAALMGEKMMGEKMMGEKMMGKKGERTYALTRVGSLVGFFVDSLTAQLHRVSGSGSAVLPVRCFKAGRRWAHTR